MTNDRVLDEGHVRAAFEELVEVVAQMDDGPARGDRLDDLNRSCRTAPGGRPPVQTDVTAESPGKHPPRDQLDCDRMRRRG